MNNLDKLVREYYEVKNENELTHYGVPGMKWGIRKAISDRRIAGLERKAGELRSRATRSSTRRSGLRSYSTGLGRNMLNIYARPFMYKKAAGDVYSRRNSQRLLKKMKPWTSREQNKISASVDRQRADLYKARADRLRKKNANR